MIPSVGEFLGAVFAMVGRFEDSLSASQKLIDLAPNLPSSHINMGGSYQALGKLQEQKNATDMLLI